MSRPPQRIVCLSAEIADWLWRLGAWDCVAGVTAFFTAPPEASPRPRVSGFSSGNIAEIIKLQPELVVTFSDVQAELAATLIKHGLPVLATNQRTLAETEATLALVARIVQREAEGETLLHEFRQRLAPVENTRRRPRVYFEEWNEPFITGIAWVSELIERAGGDDIFPEQRNCRAAAQRAVTSGHILAASPEIIFASWCGERVCPKTIQERPGWTRLPAVRAQRVFEIPGEDILQPGFRLVYGFERIKEIIEAAGRDA
jgi:iron complex transport system substrate-binding protein